MLSKNLIYLLIGLWLNPSALGAPLVRAAEKKKIITWMMTFTDFAPKEGEKDKHRQQLSRLTFSVPLQAIQKIHAKYGIFVLRPWGQEQKCILKFKVKDGNQAEEDASRRAPASYDSPFIIDWDIATNPNIIGDVTCKGLGRFIRDQGIKFQTLECEWPSYPLHDQFYQNACAMLAEYGLLINKAKQSFHFQIPLLVLFPPYRCKESFLAAFPFSAAALQEHPERKPFIITNVLPVPFCGVYLPLEDYVSITFLNFLYSSVDLFRKRGSQEEREIILDNLLSSLGPSLEKNFKDPKVSLFDKFIESFNHYMPKLQAFINKLPLEDKNKAYQRIQFLVEDLKLAKGFAFLQDTQEGAPQPDELVSTILKKVKTLKKNISDASFTYSKKVLMDEKEEEPLPLTRSLQLTHDFYQERGFDFFPHKPLLDMETFNLQIGSLSYGLVLKTIAGFPTISYCALNFDPQQDLKQAPLRHSPKGPQFLIKVPNSLKPSEIKITQLPLEDH